MLRFFGAAFAITWIAELAVAGLGIEPSSLPGLALLLVAGFGPTIAAFLVGRPAAGAPARPVLVVGALALPSILAFVFGGHPGSPDLLGAIIPPLGEEAGWRGFAQPRLVARLGGPLGFLVLGVLTAAWHLPSVFVHGGGDPAHFPLFFCETTLVSFWISWVYQRSGLVGAIVAHAALNLGLVAGGSDVFTYFAWAAIAFLVLFDTKTKA